MRKWVPIALIVLAVGWFMANTMGSSVALSDATGRPVLALTRDGARVPVRQTEDPVATDKAQLVGGSGITFGYSFVYKLPDGGLVTCTHRFQSVACDNGWQAERRPAP